MRFVATLLQTALHSCACALSYTYTVNMYLCLQIKSIDRLRNKCKTNTSQGKPTPSENDQGPIVDMAVDTTRASMRRVRHKTRGEKMLMACARHLTGLPRLDSGGSDIRCLRWAKPGEEGFGTTRAITPKVSTFQ